jgi:hypothetical protein
MLAGLVFLLRRGLYISIGLFGNHRGIITSFHSQNLLRYNMSEQWSARDVYTWLCKRNGGQYTQKELRTQYEIDWPKVVHGGSGPASKLSTVLTIEQDYEGRELYYIRPAQHKNSNYISKSLLLTVRGKDVGDTGKTAGNPKTDSGG